MSNLFKNIPALLKNGQLLSLHACTSGPRHCCPPFCACCSWDRLCCPGPHVLLQGPHEDHWQLTRKIAIKTTASKFDSVLSSKTQTATNETETDTIESFD